MQSVDVMLGFSMGGQVTYHWLALYPDMVEEAVIICSSARTSGHNYQFLEGPKAALENSADYVAEKRRAVGVREAPQGLRAFGKAYSAWLTSAAWFDQELYKELGYQTLSGWDRDVTGANYRGWHPQDLLAMLGMWQSGGISSSSLDGGPAPLENTLAGITAPVLLLPCQTDQYFHWEASEREANCMPNSQLRIIPSVWGHLAGSGVYATDKMWMDSE